jgi:UDP:flavonoid glycosyltransferase YjiC (YdhE family)
MPETNMSTIVFIPFHWASDLNPTFALARKLRNRDHRVHYLCIPDTAERIRSQGFDFTPVFSRAFPEGTLAKQSESEAQGKRYGIAANRRASSDRGTESQFVADVVGSLNEGFLWKTYPRRHPGLLPAMSNERVH